MRQAKVLPQRSITPVLCALGLACLSTPTHATDRGADPTVLHAAGDLTLRWHLQGGLNAVAEQDLFWNLADTTAPGSGYEANKAWLEAYVKPGLSFEQIVDGGNIFYGKVSIVSSTTRGTDAFDGRNTGRTTLEEAHLGTRGVVSATGLSYDVSVGPRELRVGTGMLLSSGASSGFERGALKFGPRKAWDQAVISRLALHEWTGTFFFLSPNELSSAEGNNRLVGVDARRDWSNGSYLGATLLKVRNSDSPYAQAAPGGVGAPTIIEGAREGTRALSAYAKLAGLAELPEWTFTGDMAYEWNRRLNLHAWAGRIQATRAWSNWSWTPTLTYGFQTFSGDDPNTSRLERFDPLYYEGNPSAWSTGSKSSMTFINSNVHAHSIALRIQPTARDAVTLRYSHIRANQLRSPIQFGQATRLETSGNTANVVAGVTDAHLADDLFLEFNRVLNRHTYLSAGVAISVAGRGIREVVDGPSANWTGGYVNLVVNY